MKRGDGKFVMEWANTLKCEMIGIRNLNFQ